MKQKIIRLSNLRILKSHVEQIDWNVWVGKNYEGVHIRGKHFFTLDPNNPNFESDAQILAKAFAVEGFVSRGKYFTTLIQVDKSTDEN